MGYQKKTALWMIEDEAGSIRRVLGQRLSMIGLSANLILLDDATIANLGQLSFRPLGRQRGKDMDGIVWWWRYTGYLRVLASLCGTCGPWVLGTRDGNHPSVYCHMSSRLT